MLPCCTVQLVFREEESNILHEDSTLRFAIHVSFNQLIPRLLLTSQLSESPSRKRNRHLSTASTSTVQGHLSLVNEKHWSAQPAPAAAAHLQERCMPWSPRAPTARSCRHSPSSARSCKAMRLSRSLQQSVLRLKVWLSWHRSAPAHPDAVLELHPRAVGHPGNQAGFGLKSVPVSPLCTYSQGKASKCAQHRQGGSPM